MAGQPGGRRLAGAARTVLIVGVVAALTWAIASIGRTNGAGPGASAVAGPSAVAAPGVPGHEVYGFVPYWEMDATIAAHLRETEATTIGLFSVTQTGRGALSTGQSGYRRMTGPVGRRIIADAHERGRRVEITWTSFGQAKNAGFFASETRQARLIDELVALRAELGADGIALDVEEIADRDIPAYGAFIERLRTALRADEPDATVTVATGAGRQGAALALAATVAGADRIFLMGYDYRTARSDPGGSAPLARRDGGERSLTWSLDMYLGLGIPAERTILGLPLYGLAWPTDDDALGAAATGRGDIWVPRRNIAALRDPTATSGYDAIEDVAFLAVADGDLWQAIYYDTPQSLTPKLALANERALAGAGFWALGYERGLPGYTALIGDFRAGRSMVRGGTGSSDLLPVAP